MEVAIRFWNVSNLSRTEDSFYYVTWSLEQLTCDIVGPYQDFGSGQNLKCRPESGQRKRMHLQEANRNTGL